MKIARKKKFLISIIGAAVLVLGFGAIQAQEAKALTLTKSNTCPLNYASELECYNDAAGDSGYTGCLSSIECCLTCNSYRSTCAIVNAGTDHFTEYEFNANGAGSCNDTSILSCRSGNATGACPDTTSYNGKQCIVRKVDSSNANKILYNNSDTYWDGLNKRCIACGSWTGADALTRNNTELKKCGDTSGVYLDSSGNCNSTSLDLFKFKKICGADAACDGKIYPDGGSAPACTGGTCSLSGVCVAANALTLDVSWSVNPVTVGANSTATFTVKKASDSTAVSGATVTVTSISCTAGTGTLPNPASVTNASGQTTSTFTAPAVGSTCTINAKAVLTGYTDGVITTSISATTCTGSNFSQYDYYRYAKGDSLKLDGYNPDGSWEWALCFYNGSNTLMEEKQYYDDNSANSEYYTATTTGVWKGLAVAGTGGCPSPYDASKGCPCSTDVVECEDNADCASNNCNLSTYTCVAAAAAGSVSSPLCQAALIASDIGKTCGAYTAVAADVGGYCCSASDFVFVNKTDCQASDPACAAAPGGEICADAAITDEDGNGFANCADITACPDGTACEGGGTCNGGTCVAAAIPAASCSGPGMFVSPLGLGYCTIGEILTKATNWILSLVASIIILVIIIGGLMYISSSGDEEKLRASKNIIFYAVIGLGIILISYALITEVTDILKGP
ncbi:hypothetical protein KKB43_01855 [Patescibacteria group bacterium]|nr:hypothetical protein [Patescibacteria group bacterium]